MKTNYVYPAKLEQDGDEITISFLDFPELVAFGETEEEAVTAAQEILALTLIDYLDQGKELPEPASSKDGVIYIHVWLPYFRNATKEVYVKKTVTIPAWLDLLAREKDINFSACMVNGIKEKLGI